MIKDLEIVVEDASYLAAEDNEAFAMIRRKGFGASDSSILLGVNPFPNGTVEKLLEQKRAKFVTADELTIGNMVNVRKGADLEPLIMQKFAERFKTYTKMLKPKAMYRIPQTPLTVNFDGVLTLGNVEVPVECKFVSAYGGKYYNLSKDIGTNLWSGDDPKNLGDEVNNIYIMKRSEEAGIPIYYYTQIQQQLLALGAPFGYLAALFDKDWELRVFKIMADEKVQQKLLNMAEVLWQKI